ncbi:MAG: hypothetical protein R2864_02750 [Syntrophotaleaceae bacterium]
MRKRCKLLVLATCGLAALLLASTAGAVTIRSIQPNEDVFGYVQRIKGALTRPFTNRWSVPPAPSRRGRGDRRCCR